MNSTENYKPGVRLILSKADELPELYGNDTTGLNHLLLAILLRYGPMVASLAPDLDLEAKRQAIEASLEEGDIGPQDRREAILKAAIDRAREQGKDQASERDLIAVLLQEAGWTVSPGGEPAPAQEAPAQASPQMAPKPEGDEADVVEEVEATVQPASRTKAPTASGSTARSPDERTIRVFISSTFRDMQIERDELVKRIFPQIRKLCEERGVTWGEVDLRWGITEAQSRKGEVLPICLAEIQRCRPYFIGLLGQRYGWVPDEHPDGLITEQPWLKEHTDHSITELEILHGVLNDPEMAKHAFFYFRDPAYIEGLPAEEQGECLEGPSEEEVEKYGREEAERRAEERRKKLAALKERIRRSDFPVREDYEDPAALGQRVLEDLTALVDRLFPAGEQPDPLDRQAAEHAAFARSRTGVYIGRQTYFDRLNAHATGDDDPLVVRGESGSGKSALLANWALAYREAHPDALVLTHFIGATPHSADWRAMLRRIMGEFKRRFDLPEEIPGDPDELRAAFANGLHQAAARVKVVLVLDALNQLEDREGAPDLVWLPPAIPDNVRLVVSTLSGRALDALEERGWPALEVEPLRPGERQTLIQDYLASYRKRLNPEREARMAEAPQAANPLFLRAALEELRLFGEHEALGDRIDYYLEAEGIDALYGKILARYEEDYERERPGLVREAMSLLWAARRGLSEAELLELLGADGEPLPRAYWSTLYLAAEGSLVDRAGLIDFSHDYLRQAVQDRYLETEADRRDAHRHLADYFADRELGPRVIDELPWQLEQAGEWQRLYDRLADLDFFAAAWEADEFDVKGCWSAVENHSDLRMVAAYRPVLDQPAENKQHVWEIAVLLKQTGHPEEALLLEEYKVEHYREVGDRRSLAASLGNQALILKARGDLEGAMALHEEGERICRELGDKAGLQASLGNQALILRACGDMDKAIALLEEGECICRELGDKAGLQASLGNQALILKDRGDLDEAMALNKEQERICRELGDKAGLQASLGNQALILKDRGDLDGAMALHQEQERICRDLGDKTGLHTSLGNQAVILMDRGDLDEAMALHKEQERICRELGDKAGLQRSLGNQAVIHQNRGDLDEAMALHKEKERICREVGYKSELGVSIGNQAMILKARGDLDGAMSLHKEEERICRELGDKAGLQVSLGNQAGILRDRGDLKGAMALLQEQERTCRELGVVYGLAISLANQASILGGNLNQPREALPLAEQAYELAINHGLIALARQFQPFLDTLRRMSRG